MALNYDRLKEFDKERLNELDRAVTGQVEAEVGDRKRAIEDLRAKKRKKAQKARRQQMLSRR